MHVYCCTSPNTLCACTMYMYTCIHMVHVHVHVIVCVYLTFILNGFMARALLQSLMAFLGWLVCRKHSARLLYPTHRENLVTPCHTLYNDCISDIYVHVHAHVYTYMYMYSSYHSMYIVACQNTTVHVYSVCLHEENRLSIVHVHTCTCTRIYMYMYMLS